MLPPGARRSVEPVVAPGSTVRWADLRIDAVMLDRPTQGTRAWSIPVTVGDRPVTIVGEQVWPPAPPTGLWWLATALAGIGSTILGGAAVHRRGAAVATAAVTLAVVAAHVVHVLGASLVPDGQPSYLTVVLGTAGIGLGAWLFGAIGVALTLVGRQLGLLFCSMAGAVLALITAFDAVGFSNAVLPFGWPPDLDRATVVLTFGAGAGLFLTGFAVLRRLTPVELEVEHDGAGRPLDPRPG